MSSSWDQRFQIPGLLFGSRPNQYLESQTSRLNPGMKALLVADGEGRNGVWLAKRGLRVDTFDSSLVAVAKAQAFASKEGVSISTQVCSWQDWPWSERRFDVVAAIFVQFAPPGEREQLFARMRSSLAPAGLLVVQGYTPEQLNYRTGGPDNPAQLYTREWLLAQCQGLRVLDLTEERRVLQEGSAHLGLSATIGITAMQAPA